MILEGLDIQTSGNIPQQVIYKKSWNPNPKIFRGVGHPWSFDMLK